LIGKGYDVCIYDPLICPDRLVGANRQEVMTRLPHVGRLLVSSPEEAMKNVDIAVVSSNEPSVVAALLSVPPARIIDLNGGLGPEVEALPGYEGLGW
jgi:GDP-mannose 6-dehydrogenase